MLIAAAAIIAGFIILIWSADLFVTGAAAIAENAGLSPIIIGLTVVSLGTSAPEVLVSLTASLAGAGELAVGNAIGSNIANIGLVLGLTIIIAPLMVHHGSMRKEMIILLVVTLAVALLVLDGTLSRLDGWLMATAMVLFLVHVVRKPPEEKVLLQEVCEEPLPHLNPGRAWLTFSLGLILLIASSRMLVWGAVIAANALGVSELIIGLTVIAVGTSLPELASTVACAMRGHTEIALGNVIGSNLFNLLAVMSIPGILGPELLEPAVTSRDYPAMTFMTILLGFAIYLSRLRSKAVADHAYLGRVVGVLLVSLYAAYYYWIYITI